MTDFIPLLLGNDINAYSMARAFYEAYGTTTAVFCKTTHGPCAHSKICRVDAHPQMDLPQVFVPKVLEFAAKHQEKTILILGCGDNYVEQIIVNKDKFPPNILAPYIDKPLMDRLIRKRDFYEMCDQYGIDYPKTFVYEPDMGFDFALPFAFPVIMKPSDGVKYWHNPFDSQKKVYKLDTMDALKAAIAEIYEAGYTDDMIIQDMIPGDDSCMRVMTALSGKDHKTLFTALGHPLLEEHTPHGLGNTSIIFSEQDLALSGKIAHFLEAISYTGFSNFDLKYDSRDGKIKVFEINCRQGRNNYYVTGGGLNMAEYLCDEFIYGKQKTPVTANHDSLWTVIPMGVAYRFIKDKQYIPRLKAMVKAKKMKNPLFLKGDLSLPRLYYLLRSHYSHYIKYWKYYR